LAAAAVRDVVEDQNIEIVLHTRDYLLNGLALYEARPDKGYSLTDCVSMLAMRERGISEVLTHDHHFEQEGFTILL
jgi:predicted nucleic acid-binding protein